MLISFFVPAALLAIRMGVIKVSASRRTSLKFRGNTLSHVLGCVAGVGTTAVVTEYTKVIIGRPRPNYLALQQMEGYETESIKSFPSGHASCSMASLGYMTFIAWGDILSTHRNKSTIKVYMAVPPLILAFWIGLTRIRDYWHHHDDVFAGQALGFLCSYTAYRNLGVLTALGQGEGSGEPLISPTRRSGVAATECYSARTLLRTHAHPCDEQSHHLLAVQTATVSWPTLFLFVIL
ncbi:unnamed protein product [Chrysoparadoxa australica]